MRHTDARGSGAQAGPGGGGGPAALPEDAPGMEALREAGCAYWHRRGLHTGPGQVVAAPGAPLLMLALLTAADPAGGGVLLPRPTADWHAVPARLLGRTAHRVPVPADCGGVPDPFVLLETVRRARAGGDDPRTLVLSVADDPTGTAAPPELLHEVCEAASGEGLLVVSDESGRDSSHDPHDTVIVSPAEMLGAAHSDAVVVLTGTASVALGRFPGTARGHGLAREVRAVLAALHARVPAATVRAGTEWFAEPADLRERRAAEAVRQGVLAVALHDAAVQAGGLCRPPQLGEHVYVDFEPARSALAAHGVVDAAGLEAELVRRLGAGADGGHRYGDDPHALRVRLATRLLTGADDPEAPDPLRAPRVAHALGLLRATLAALTTP